jgi:hypothetical protein
MENIPRNSDPLTRRKKRAGKWSGVEKCDKTG